MNKNRKQSRPTGKLDKKLAVYSLAGAAALIIPGAASADIVYVGNVDQTVNEIGNYDFSGSPFAGDITITAEPGPSFDSPPSYSNDINANTSSGAEVLVNSAPNSGYVTALGFGAMIDPTSTTNWNTGGKLSGYDNGIGASGGYWSTTGETSYLGFQFGGPTDPTAGWAEIATTASASGSSFEILSYAYETAANTPITAGEGSPVPEPYALPLLALGGVGLIALRRRRAANA